jgi:phosphoribosylformylglycinamidine cyclo-ligase
MTTYKESGVDVELGDRCSGAAYAAAKGTFAGRAGMVGQPVTDEGGFAGLLDMGDFYLVQNDDGVGTKIEVAEKMRKFDTLGYDLVAMVADDAVCLGAEVISVSNTLDAPKLDAGMVEGLMAGLQKAALEQKIVVPGGELAELGSALNGNVWNATAVGIVAKDRVITGAGIQAGDAVIGLKSAGIRSNGMSLARMILQEAFGENWVSEKYDESRTWGEVILTPSKIYHAAVLNIIGRYGEKKTHSLKGIVHNTGGGIRGNLPRLLKKHGFGARLDSLIKPHEFMLKLMELGKVSKEEAYKTWNMGVGMMMVTGSEGAEDIVEAFLKQDIDAQVIGMVTEGQEIQF